VWQNDVISKQICGSYGDSLAERDVVSLRLTKSKEGDILESNDFEKAYANFIDRREYDEAQNALFMMVRTSFTAGWQAAGGDLPTPHKIFDLLPKKDKEESE